MYSTFSGCQWDDLFLSENATLTKSDGKVLKTSELLKETKLEPVEQMKTSIDGYFSSSWDKGNKNAQVVDLSEQCDFSKLEDRNYAQLKLEQKPRLIILRAGLDRPPRDPTMEDRARKHIQHVHELAAQQHANGGGFIVVSDRDKSIQLLSMPDCAFVPLSVC